MNHQRYVKSVANQLCDLGFYTDGRIRPVRTKEETDILLINSIQEIELVQKDIKHTMELAEVYCKRQFPHIAEDARNIHYLKDQFDFSLIASEGYKEPVIMHDGKVTTHYDNQRIAQNILHDALALMNSEYAAQEEEALRDFQEAQQKEQEQFDKIPFNDHLKSEVTQLAYQQTEKDSLRCERMLFLLKPKGHAAEKQLLEQGIKFHATGFGIGFSVANDSFLFIHPSGMYTFRKNGRNCKEVNYKRPNTDTSLHGLLNYGEKGLVDFFVHTNSGAVDKQLISSIYSLLEIAYDLRKRVTISA